MTNKPKFDKKLYRERVKQFKASFAQFIVEKKFLDPAPEPGSYVTWNQLELWATAIMMDEAMTLSKLTRALIALTGVLAVLTAVLVFRSL